MASHADRKTARGQSTRWRTRVPWTTKLRANLEPKLVANPRGPGCMLVPTPLTVAEEIRRVPKGRVITVKTLRERLARRFGAEVTCPMTTGIFLVIIAGATEEQLSEGRRGVAPYWRIVDERGGLNPKWPAGAERQAQHLRAEGHAVVRNKTTDVWLLKDFDRFRESANSREAVEIPR